MGRSGMPNLALGTAQLGMRYGISHMDDMPTAEHVCKLISYAKQKQRQGRAEVKALSHT